VSDLLNKNPHAKAIYRADSADNIAEITDAKIENAARRAVAHKKVTRKLSNSTKMDASGDEMLPPLALDRQPQRCMLLDDVTSAPLPIRIPGQPSSEDSSVPQDVCIAQLISIVECLLTFASTLMPWTDGEYHASMASTAKVVGELCASEDRTLSDVSQLQLLHARLVELLMEAWSEGIEPDSSAGAPPCPKEFPAFISYFAETQLPLQKVTDLRREYGPPAVAQESYVQAAVGITLPSSYLEISPGSRVSMLYSLLHDVLDTGSLRQEIDTALDIEIEEERKETARRAEARRLAREEYKRKRDQMIASLIADSNLTALSLEEQRLVVDKARQRVAEDLADRFDVDASPSSSSTRQPSKVRVVPCAADFQTGGVSYRVACSEMLTGCDDAVVICSQGGVNGDEPVDFTGQGVVHLYKADKFMCT
jgi:hypothetical protein